MKSIQIKIASDVVCPWCLIGKRELEKAIEELKSEYHFELQFLPFELAPDMPVEGEDFKTHITNKFGDFEMFLQKTQMLIDRGTAIGIDFNMREMPKTPNTFLMHRIIQFAYQSGLQVVVKGAYMSAYFVERIDLTDIETVIAIAVRCGLDEEHVRTLVASQEGANEIKELQNNMRSMGITGVPFFIINDQYALSGAVPAAQLVEAFRKINETEQV